MLPVFLAVVVLDDNIWTPCQRFEEIVGLKEGCPDNVLPLLEPIKLLCMVTGMKGATAGTSKMAFNLATATSASHCVNQALVTQLNGTLGPPAPKDRPS